MIPMNKFIEVKLESIEVCGLKFEFSEKVWGDIISTYQQESVVDECIDYYKSTSIWPYYGELVEKDFFSVNQLVKLGQSFTYYNLKNILTMSMHVLYP